MSNASRSLAEPGKALPRRVPAWIYLLAVLGVAIGAAAFGLGAASADPAPAWRALLINFLYWTSLGQGLFLWAVIFRVARTTWSGPLNRLGHSTIWFLGASVPLLLALSCGRRYYLPWTHMDLGDRAIWLNARSLFLRDGVGLAALFLLSLGFVRTYLREESAVAEGADPARRRRASRRLSVLGVLLAAAYMVVSTLIGLDLVMSLTPGWYSTLFGWYYSIGGLYLGMAGLIVMVVLLRRWLSLSECFGRQQFQDMGNLLMAFAMAMTYFFYAQALVIWYEDLPPETSFAIPRVHVQPWRALSWVVLGACYLGPFALMVMREMKQNWRTLVGVAGLVLAAMWLERYLLVAPSLSPRSPDSPLLALLISAGFLGLFILTVAPFLARHPSVSALDLALIEERQAWGGAASPEEDRPSQPPAAEAGG